MTAAMLYEWVRLRTLRVTWWLLAGSLAGSAVMTWGYSAVIVGVSGDGLPVDPREAAVLLVSKASAAPLVAGIIGVLAVGNEYRHATMTTALIVTPRRAVLLAAKAAVAVCFGHVLAVGGFVVAWLVAALTVGDIASSMSASDLVHLHVGHLVLVAGWAVLGVAVAGILRSQLVSLAVMTATPYAIEPAVRGLGLLSGQSWVQQLAAHLPFAAGGAMTDITGGLSDTVLSPALTRVDPLSGTAVFLGAVAVVTSVAVLHFRRVDVS